MSISCSIINWVEYPARIPVIFKSLIQPAPWYASNITPCGSAPWGYSIKDKHLVPNEYAEHVLRAFKAFSINGSINGALIDINGLEGLPRLQSGLKSMLSNPVYIGEYRGNPNFCPPIIPRDLWDEVQRQLPMNVKKN